MKNKFIIRIALLFFVATVSIGVFEYQLFRIEQWRLIDERIETTASLLLSSDLNKSDLEDFESARLIVKDVVGSEPFNQFVRIYNKRHEVIYQSGGMIELPPHSDINSQWQTITGENGTVVRLLNVPLNRIVKKSTNQNILQVGLVLNDELIRLSNLKRILIIFMVVVFIVVFIFTRILVKSLLSPLKQMSLVINHMMVAISEGTGAVSLQKMTTQIIPFNDEFSNLIQDIEKLGQQINVSVQKTNRWTAQMAHEIRTPLTILQNILDKISLDSPPSKALLVQAANEIQFINSLINQFLAWVKSQQLTKASLELHALWVGREVTTIIKDYENKERIELIIASDFNVFANPSLFRQLISNILDNALKYSPSDLPIIISIDNHTLKVRDHGPGFPQAVLDNLGKPFNHDNTNSKGFGLGLAWIKVITDLYDIKVIISRETLKGQAVTCFELNFMTYD